MVGPLQAGAPRSIAGLYALTPERSDIDAMTKCVAAALGGGATTIQYRNKTAAPKLRLQQALALRALCAERRATFIVNDDIDLARMVDADGVHLGRGDATIALARTRLRTTALVGASCYDSLELAEAAVAAGADGLLIEVHPSPDHALKDGFESLTFDNFEKLMATVPAVAGAVGRPVSVRA